MKQASIRAWTTRVGFTLAVGLLVFCGSRLMGDDAAAVEITRKAYRIAQNGQIRVEITARLPSPTRCPTA